METTIGNVVESHVSKVSEAKYLRKRHKDPVKNLFLGNSKKVLSEDRDSSRNKDFVFLHQDKLYAEMKITNQDAVDYIIEAVKSSLRKLRSQFTKSF